jgi:hypothetical protein
MVRIVCRPRLDHQDVAATHGLTRSCDRSRYDRFHGIDLLVALPSGQAPPATLRSITNVMLFEQLGERPFSYLIGRTRCRENRLPADLGLIHSGGGRRALAELPIEGRPPCAPSYRPAAIGELRRLVARHVPLEEANRSTARIASPLPPTWPAAPASRCLNARCSPKKHLSGRISWEPDQVEWMPISGVSLKARFGP